MTNSHPSGPRPWRECGVPGGKYQRSPAFTSATYGRPSASRTVTRQLPYVMIAHADATCGQPHVDPRDFLRNRKVVDRHLTRPATVLDTLCRVVERGPSHG